MKTSLPQLPVAIVSAYLRSLGIIRGSVREEDWTQQMIRRLLQPVILTDMVSSQVEKLKPLPLKQQMKKDRGRLLTLNAAINREFMDPLHEWWGLLADEMSAVEDYICDELVKAEVCIDNGLSFLSPVLRELLRRCFLADQFALTAGELLDRSFPMLPPGRHPARRMQDIHKAILRLVDFRAEGGEGSAKDIEVTDFWKRQIDDQLFVLKTRLLEWSA